MARWTRRGWLAAAGSGLAALARSSRGEAMGRRQAAAPPAMDSGKLPLVDFQPKSMLHVPETHVPRARYPVIDVHTHVTFRSKGKAGVPLGEDVRINATPEALLAGMDKSNLRIMVDLTGGVGAGLAKSVATFQTPHPDRFVVFTEPSYDRITDPGYAQWQAEELRRAKAAGARGVKVLKTLGLYLREQVTSGPLVPIDDKRFDPLWEEAGGLGLPIAIHIADPEAFFLPIDRFNERYEELHAHPDWSFHGRDYPSFNELIAARDRMLAKHPKTTFVCLHVGHDSENLAAVSQALDRFPNMMVETAARIGELGRQPRTSRKFFDRYQDRILFGTDASPAATDTPQQVFGGEMYSIYFRFLETEDEYFDYAPSPVPPQGRWRIYGIGLPDDILKKVYYANAERVLSL